MDQERAPRRRFNSIDSIWKIWERMDNAVGVGLCWRLYRISGMNRVGIIDFFRSRKKGISVRYVVLARYEGGGWRGGRWRGELSCRRLWLRRLRDRDYNERYRSHRWRFLADFLGGARRHVCRQRETGDVALSRRARSSGNTLHLQ